MAQPRLTPVDFDPFAQSPTGQTTPAGSTGQARDDRAGRFILWSDSDDPEAVLERVELCGLPHEECLDLLDEPERLK